MMKKHIMFIALTSLLLVLSACGMDTGDNNQNHEKENENTGVEKDESGTGEDADQSPSDSETVNSEDESEDEDMDGSDAEDGVNDDSESVTQETGIYNGQADPHTIEIETEGGPMAFQLTMDARDDVEELVEGEEVTYSYTEDGDTRTIESIQKKD